MQSKQPTRQLETWSSDFGREYTDRNPISAEEMDRELGAYYGGVRKSDIFRQFLGPDRLPCGRLLEVGCNVGTQLRLMQVVNPGLEPYGIEPQPYALARARQVSPEIHFLPGSAFELPFRDGYFEAVMTNGVLIHIHPDDLGRALSEIHRCSKRYVFLHEYFAEQPREVRYRGTEGLLWKMDYMRRYLELFPRLRAVEVRYLEYPDPDGGPPLVDQICLLKIGGT